MMLTPSRVLKEFRVSKDTADIAKQYGVAEALVAKLLEYGKTEEFLAKIKARS